MNQTESNNTLEQSSGVPKLTSQELGVLQSPDLDLESDDVLNILDRVGIVPTDEDAEADIMVDGKEMKIKISKEDFGTRVVDSSVMEKIKEDIVE